MITTRDLGLAAFVKMSGCKLVEVKKQEKEFVFETEEDIKSWELKYMNSCCRIHDSELVALRKLLY
jgi:hypothetical protein